MVVRLTATYRCVVRNMTSWIDDSFFLSNWFIMRWIGEPDPTHGQFMNFLFFNASVSFRHLRNGNVTTLSTKKQIKMVWKMTCDSFHGGAPKLAYAQITLWLCAHMEWDNDDQQQEVWKSVFALSISAKYVWLQFVRRGDPRVCAQSWVTQFELTRSSPFLEM